MPSLIVSDNAKTFKAAERSIRQLFNQPKVKAEFQTKRVTWRFNLERVPWWGRFFELVRSTKWCLKGACQCKTNGIGTDYSTSRDGRYIKF